MPHQDDETDPVGEHHKDLSATERKVLSRVARGESDEEIGEREGMTIVAVHSCLRRFRERTRLAGRRLSCWAARHETCCISIAV